jgi:type IV pilus assembly protein PilX
MRTHQSSPVQRQRGAVLIVSLLFLVVLTILGITAMQGTTLEHRMAGNTRDYAVAMQAAEAALRDAHRDINPRPNEQGRNTPPMVYGNSVDGVCGNTPGATGNKGLCMAVDQVKAPSGDYILPPTLNLLTQPYVEYGEFTGADKLRGVVGGTNNAVLPIQPRYWVEALCNIAPRADESLGTGTGITCGFRRITARGYGINPNTQVTLQEVYRIAQF